MSTASEKATMQWQLRSIPARKDPSRRRCPGHKNHAAEFRFSLIDLSADLNPQV